jgi:hypothetical protein
MAATEARLFLRTWQSPSPRGRSWTEVPRIRCKATNLHAGGFRRRPAWFRPPTRREGCLAARPRDPIVHGPAGAQVEFGPSTGSVGDGWDLGTWEGKTIIHRFACSRLSVPCRSSPNPGRRGGWWGRSASPGRPGDLHPRLPGSTEGNRLTGEARGARSDGRHRERRPRAWGRGLPGSSHPSELRRTCEDPAGDDGGSWRRVGPDGIAEPR